MIVREQGGQIYNKKYKKPKLQTKTVNLFESDNEDVDDFSKIIGTSMKDCSTVRKVVPTVKENFIKTE